MVSLRSILTLIVVIGSLLPAYWVGSSMIDKHQEDLLAQKALKLENSNQGIRKTVEDDLTFIANLTRSYSKDRLLVQGMDNVLYSSIIWQKSKRLKSWQPMSALLTSSTKIGSQCMKAMAPSITWKRVSYFRK